MLEARSAEGGSHAAMRRTRQMDTLNPWVTFIFNLCSMKAMSFAMPRRVRHLRALCAVAWLTACHKDDPGEGERPPRAMDGLERYTARTVSIETALEAMQQRDLKKLKMLGVWVRNRDKTVLLTADDLSSLDLAIDCIEGTHSKEERSAALEQIKSGKLKAGAREVCLEEQE